MCLNKLNYILGKGVSAFYGVGCLPVCLPVCKQHTCNSKGYEQNAMKFYGWSRAFRCSNTGHELLAQISDSCVVRNEPFLYRKEGSKEGLNPTKCKAAPYTPG